MWMQEDRTYREIRKKSLLQWLEELEKHEDPAVRGGVTLARGYLTDLETDIERLKQENRLKNEYLKKAALRK